MSTRYSNYSTASANLVNLDLFSSTSADFHLYHITAHNDVSMHMTNLRILMKSELSCEFTLYWETSFLMSMSMKFRYNY